MEASRTQTTKCTLILTPEIIFYFEEIFQNNVYMYLLHTRHIILLHTMDNKIKQVSLKNIYDTYSLSSYGSSYTFFTKFPQHFA